jgi:hypothetical protein
VLEAAGCCCGEGAFGEAFAVVAAGALGEFSVDDGTAERAFGGVVGWFDGGVGGEGPERRPDVQQVLGEPAVVAGARGLARGVLDERAQL